MARCSAAEEEGRGAAAGRVASAASRRGVGADRDAGGAEGDRVGGVKPSQRGGGRGGAGGPGPPDAATGGTLTPGTTACRTITPSYPRFKPAQWGRPIKTGVPLLGRASAG